MSSERTPATDIIRKFHAGAIELADSLLERALRIAPADGKASLPSLLRRFGNQNFTFAGLPFPHLREVFRVIKPRPDELFCDAGAGYGHVVFYGACVAPCRFRAIEILPARCAAMKKTADRLGLAGIDIIQGDALAQNYDDVSYLLLNNPFFPEMAQRFIDRLTVSRKRPLTVIALHNIVDVLRGNVAFTELKVGADIPDYCFGVFRLKSGRRPRPRIKPAATAPSRPARTKRTAGAVRTGAISVRGGIARR
jgi:hypothetical protein